MRQTKYDDGGDITTAVEISENTVLVAHSGHGYYGLAVVTAPYNKVIAALEANHADYENEDSDGDKNMWDYLMDEVDEANIEVFGIEDNDSPDELLAKNINHPLVTEIVEILNERENEDEE